MPDDEADFDPEQHIRESVEVRAELEELDRIELTCDYYEYSYAEEYAEWAKDVEDGLKRSGH